MRELIVAVRESAPFGLRFEAERAEVKANSKITLKLRVDWLWPDLKNPINLLPLSFPGRFRMSGVEVTPGKREIALTIEVQPGTPPGEYTLAVLGQTQVPYSRDTKAKQKVATLVSLPSRPLTLVVLP
jgi:hypothetical protein